MNKRGISSVVANVLIVLLVVGAIAIMWGFIRPLIVESGDEIGTEQFTLNLKIVDDSVRIDADANLLQRMKIQRMAGKGELVGAKIILIGDTGKSIVWPKEGLAEIKELETTILEFGETVEDGAIPYGEIVDVRLVEIKVAPVWKTSKGKEKVGNPTDEYRMTGNEFALGCFNGGPPNGVVEEGEQCDDGDDYNYNDCLNNCEEASCGDGHVWEGIEDCDGNTQTCDAGGYSGTQVCLDSCTWDQCFSEFYCGDGTLNGDEACDFEDEDDEYDVNSCPVNYVADCESEDSCDFCSNGSAGVAACSIGTLLGGCCGDGTLNGDEACDAGSENGEYGNGCDATCNVGGPYCGDGRECSNSLDSCDDGAGGRICLQADNGESYCVDDMDGNGNYEECDDGTNNGAYGTCKADCTLASYCGDGVVNNHNNEVCDDGNSAEDDVCSNDCQLTFCGDEIIQFPNGEGIDEVCDDSLCGTGMQCCPQNSQRECKCIMMGGCNF